MNVTISNCPLIFHDGEELTEFFQNSGKLLHLLDGQSVYVDGVYSYTIRILVSIFPFREYVTYYRCEAAEKFLKE